MKSFHNPVIVWCLVIVSMAFAACQSTADQPKTVDSQMRENSMDITFEKLEIIELLNRHQIYIDLKDAERYADVYAPDGRYESPFASAQGTAELVAMSRKLEASGFTKNKRHFNGPMMIDIDGDRATALSYWWVADYTEKQPVVFATGTYRDELRKINGQWKIAHRIQEGDSDESAKK